MPEWRWMISWPFFMRLVMLQRILIVASSHWLYLAFFLSGIFCSEFSNWLARSILFLHPCHNRLMKICSFHIDNLRPKPIIAHDIHMDVYRLVDYHNVTHRAILFMRELPVYYLITCIVTIIITAFVNSVTDIIVNFLFQCFWYLWKRNGDRKKVHV